MSNNNKPFEDQDIVEKLMIRAQIRRQIGRTKDGKPDRIASTCEDAAKEILRLRETVDRLQHIIDNSCNKDHT